MNGNRARYQLTIGCDNLLDITLVTAATELLLDRTDGDIEPDTIRFVMESFFDGLIPYIDKDSAAYSDQAIYQLADICTRAGDRLRRLAAEWESEASP